MTTPLQTLSSYNDALAAGDMDAFVALLAPEIVWHQPGSHPLSGDHTGPGAVLDLLGGFMTASAGTFQVRPTDAPRVNGDLVALPVEFSGAREGRADLAMAGTDLFRISGGLIREVWLFSADQDVENAFWA
ncbi:ketosteroid isomerase [Serinibacter arcticus]|uniref:Ketosteroid isomerase n=1 Tax=Serinibacter arcticus TaxID=1655435 RepID=A0A2U1ZT70_9MICO|nr:nuclear transport factor 2 family protein [Serinibacter arcticus]PWD50185.1 ketosteroid isomerase [Serinibacter arcticus]